MTHLILLACTATQPEAEDVAPLVPASKKVTFATVEQLGPHRLDATIDRTSLVPDQAPVTSRETLSLRWQDAFHWQVVTTRDGEAVSDVIVWEQAAYESLRGGPWKDRGDAEPWRLQLATTWDPWTMAFESLAERLDLAAVAMEDIEGRRAWRHGVSLLPPPQGARRVWNVTAAEGDVWIDELTAVRLVGRVKVNAETKGRSKEVLLQFAVNRIGGDPGVVPPPSSDVPGLAPPP